jgi:hypothetical protein
MAPPPYSQSGSDTMVWAIEPHLLLISHAEFQNTNRRFSIKILYLLQVFLFYVKLWCFDAKCCILQTPLHLQP